MTTLMKRKIVRCVELKLGGKPYSLYFDHAGFVVNPERVSNLEAECGDSLPLDYKEFILAYNGARLLPLSDTDSPKPVLSHISNIKEVSDFSLLSSILAGVNYEKNSLALIGSNHDGSVYTLMNVNGKKKGEIYQFNSREGQSQEFLKSPAFKSFTELLQSVSKSEYAKQISKSAAVKSLSISKSASPPRDDESDSRILPIPINSKKFPLLSEVVNNLFERVETEDNEYGRIVVKNKQEKRKIILLMTYVRDTLHEQGDNDIQSYLDFFSPFKLYLVLESELEDLMKEGLIDENDEITKKGVEEAEKIIVEESEKIAKKEIGNPRPPFKGFVDVMLNGKATPLQLTQIGTIVNETRLKKFEKDLGSAMPKEYKEFLLAYNGGISRQTNLTIDGNTQTAGIKMFRDLQTLEDRLYLGGSQNIEWMAIGTDKNEHLVYINLRGEKRGQIYRYNYEDFDEEGNPNQAIDGFTDAPKQLLAKSFLEFVLNVALAEDDDEEREGDQEYLDSLLSDDTKTKFPQIMDVMWTIYQTVEKQENKYGRITLPNKDDAQSVILLVKYFTSPNAESFINTLNHTPFRFFTVLDTHIDDLKKAKLLDKSGVKLTKKGREEVERLIAETKIIEDKPDLKKVKDKKKDVKSPKTPPKSAEKPLKRKLEKQEDTETGRHTRSSTKEGGSKKR